MAKARCPKCGEEGECEHEAGGHLSQGVVYNEYSFKCPKCGYGTIHKDGVELSDPNVLVRIPIGHTQDICPYCGGTCGAPTK